MRILAYCAASAEQSVTRAAGRRPLLSPPVNFMRILPVTLQRRDLIYLRLFGGLRHAYLYGDTDKPALSTYILRDAHMDGAIVYLNGAPLGDSPFPAAIYAGGAGVLIGSPTNHIPRLLEMLRADQMGCTFRRLLQLGFGPAPALLIARRLLGLLRPDEASEYALGFRIIEPPAPKKRPAKKKGDPT